MSECGAHEPHGSRFRTALGSKNGFSGEHIYVGRMSSAHFCKYVHLHKVTGTRRLSHARAIVHEQLEVDAL